jgi:integrase
MGISSRVHRSLKTTNHAAARARWPSVYQQLQQETLRRLQGQPPSTIRHQVQEALQEKVISEDRSYEPLEFFGPIELAEVLSGQRFDPDPQATQHPDWLQTYQVLAKQASWDSLQEIHAQKALRRRGRPLSKDWYRQVGIAIRRALAAGLDAPEKIDKEAVRKLYRSLDDVTDTTRSKVMSLLAALVQTGIEEDALDLEANPFRLVSFSAVTRHDHQRRAFTKEELEVLFRGDHGGFFQLLVCCGFRVSELLSRDPTIHLDGQVLIINDYKEFRPKTLSSYRRVPVPAALMPLVKDLLPIRQAPLTIGNRLRAAVRAVSDDPRLVVHSTRHTFMTLGRATGVPPDVLQEISGHSKASRTADGYGHYPDSVLVEAVEAIYGKVMAG